MKHMNTDILAKLALLVVAIVWGSSLVVVKSSTDTLPSIFLLALRFTIGCLTLALIFHKKLRLLMVLLLAYVCFWLTAARRSE